MMTKKDALSYAIYAINILDVVYHEVEPDNDALQILQKMIDQLSKPRKRSEEAKNAANERRKAAAASARAAVVEKVAPILRWGLSDIQQYTRHGVTAKELFALVENKLPDGFTPAQITNILTREMAPELDKIERKGKPNLYRLAEANDPNQYLPDEVAV